MKNPGDGKETPMGRKTWTIRELLKVTAEFLQEKRIESPRLAAEVLLAHQLQTDRLKLYLAFEQPLTDPEISGYRSLVRRRINREPIQYITGRQEFWSLDLLVGPGVLIPRPETELLVEQALKLVRENKLPVQATYRIFDLGTGSGAIALALVHELENARLWAADISPAALETARANARRLDLEQKIEFIQGDLWEAVAPDRTTFDIIVSNPPYINEALYAGLAPEVRDYEPKIALDGRAGGLYYIEKIIARAFEFLNPGGWLLLEMDPRQTGKALDLLRAMGCYENLEYFKDYSGHDRVVAARRKI